ncbi:MAG TPA: phosphohistidine phosphatase SixA [Anaerolineales bacterium]
MILYIVRHAIAEQRDSTSSEVQDSQRPLTDEGRKKFRQIARGLEDRETRIDLILTSPYLRALDTARLLHKKLELDPEKLLIMEDLSPLGNPDQLIHKIGERYASVGSIALVGHEPGLSRLIAVLLSGDPTLPITLKKGGVCCLTVERLKYGRCASLEWLLTPAMLSG